MKRFLAGFLTLVLLLTGITLAASADTWDDFFAHLEYEGDKIHYIESDGSVFKGGWKKTVITNTWTNEDGSTGSNTQDVWIYAKEDGALAQDEWLEQGGKWYYFGWIQMATGTFKDEQGTFHLFGDDGAWTGASAKDAGWVKSGSDWYYLEVYSTEYGTDGYFYNNDSYMINDVPYFFDKNGKMGSNGWQKQTWNYSDGTSDTAWYYAQPNGALATGWKKIDGVWYYFSKWGYMYNDILNVKIGDNRYAFRGSGAMVEDSWYSVTWTYDDGTTDTFWVYANKDGSLATGWKQIDGTWYYFWENGQMATGWLNTDDEGKTWYYLDKSGAMVSGGWQKIDGLWYYFDESGVQVMNSWIKDGDSWYYVVDDMLKDGTYTIDGKEYTFDASGAWIK